MALLARLPWLDILIGVAVGVFGLWRAAVYGPDVVLMVVSVGMGVAAGLARRAPAAALGLVWVTSTLQVGAGRDIALVQLAVVFVAYGASRYGRTATVWLSGLSIPLGAVIAVGYALIRGPEMVQDSGLIQILNLTTTTTELSFSSTASSIFAGFVIVMVVLGGPWALGLLFRLRDQSRRAAEERTKAQADALRANEVAAVREEQARLARDVHDVVGHSLAVIVAQADSAQFLPDEDIDRIRTAMANIAGSARRSLGDVRQVLSTDPADGADGFGVTRDLDALVEGVRIAGNDLRHHTRGTPRPLPPELSVVAYRTLQEMLTNALKHGKRDGAIDVDLEWSSAELCIQVRNLEGEGASSDEPGGGIGLSGMRQRLEAIGGRLSTDADAEGAEHSFTATAWLPVRVGEAS